LPSGFFSVSRKVVVAKQLSLIRSPDVLNYFEKPRLGKTAGFELSVDEKGNAALL
jgi:hypothetical protein